MAQSTNSGRVNRDICQDGEEDRGGEQRREYKGGSGQGVSRRSCKKREKKESMGPRPLSRQSEGLLNRRLGFV